MSDQLGAVTDTEDRDTKLVNLWVDRWRAIDMYRLGTTGEDDADGLALGNLCSADRVRDDLGIDIRLSNPASDQLGILRTEINDEDRLL